MLVLAGGFAIHPTRPGYFAHVIRLCFGLGRTRSSRQRRETTGKSGRRRGDRPKVQLSKSRGLTKETVVGLVDGDENQDFLGLMRARLYGMRLCRKPRKKTTGRRGIAIARRRSTRHGGRHAGARRMERNRREAGQPPRQASRSWTCLQGRVK